MVLFEKFAVIEQIQSDLAELGAAPFGVVTEEMTGATQGQVEGRELVIACSNNYLGLTFDSACIEAAKQALDRSGTGTTGSRMASGTYGEHVRLEKELAHFFRRKYSIVFSTGFSATMGVASTIAGPGETILLDADSHASIYDGARLSGADIVRFRHNDVADLEKRLKRLGEGTKKTVIIVEGIYSMLGDAAPLSEIVSLKTKYGACLVVDEAHSMGVLGETGRGLAEKLGVEGEVDFVMGTFSKSLGAIGGYCVSNHSVLEQIRFAARSYIFTASLPPSVVASTREALRIIETGSELRQRLWANAERLYFGLKGLGLELGPEVGPVIAVKMPDSTKAVIGWKMLMQRGVYVNLVIPPASPSSYSLFRCSVSAGHSSSQIDFIIDAFDYVSRLECTAA